MLGFLEILKGCGRLIRMAVVVVMMIVELVMVMIGAADVELI
jgi:hypothetical protein